jgi:hypothetical protein
MKFQVFEYTCGNCAAVFEAPALSEMSYGEFLLRSRRGALAYLNAINDPTYKEVSTLISRERASLRPVDQAIILRRAFGPVACDWDNGDSPPSPFDIEASPVCPHCHQQRPRSWRAKHPPATVDVDVPSVSHAEWNGLANAKKMERLRVWLAKDRR